MQVSVKCSMSSKQYKTNETSLHEKGPNSIKKYIYTNAKIHAILKNDKEQGH